MHIGTQYRAIEIREREQVMFCHSCRTNTSRFCRAALIATMCSRCFHSCRAGLLLVRHPHRTAQDE